MEEKRHEVAAATAGTVSYPLRVGDRQIGYVSVPIELASVTAPGEVVLSIAPGKSTFTLPGSVCEDCDTDGHDLEVVLTLTSGPLPVGTLRCCPTCQPDLIR